MRVERKGVGDACMLAGSVLWLIAVLADAATIVVVMPILLLMAGALLTVTGRARQPSDRGDHRVDTLRRPLRRGTRR